MNSINVGGKLLGLETPKIMGVLNVTPDSFYDGGKYNNLDLIAKRVQTMRDEGMDVLDIGAFSSRPGAKLIAAEEELSRLKPVVKEVVRLFPDIMLSLDSYRSEVVKSISEISPFIVNDITGFDEDPDILNVTADLGLPYILMHMHGTPETMQSNPVYEDVGFEILNFMAKKIVKIRSMGVKDIIVDPGFGFGKTVEHNFTILKQLNVFNIFDCPVLVGLSRKSMICKTLKIDPKNALNGTTALHMVALMNGARILRVHDVKAAHETITLWKELQGAVKN